MKKILQDKTLFFNLKKFSGIAILVPVLVGLCNVSVSAQKKTVKKPVKKAAVQKAIIPIDRNLPKATQVDAPGLQKILKRGGEATKPLLVNFWATWCSPCVEEFPDLVKINNDYQGKIDFITVTLDDLSEINTGVPKFLAKTKATMPTYLLKTDDETAAINSIYDKWQGALPFTILFDKKGGSIYSIQGKVKPEILRAEIEKALVK